MDDAIFSKVKADVVRGDNRYLGLLHEEVMTLANVALGADSLWLQLDEAGKRILEVSQRALTQIFTCAYAWRFTGEEKFLRRAEADMLSVCRFESWNARRHFLDTGEMCAAVALGYDWLYPALSEDTKAMALEAIRRLAFSPALEGVWNLDFYHSDGNWNQVCNGGLVLGALAVYERCPEEARTIIEKAIEANPLPMGQYAPDGNYPEGLTYWAYGSCYEMMMLSAIESCLGTDFGLSALPGFLDSGRYVLFSYGPSGMIYNYSDNTAAAFPQYALWYLAWKKHEPSLLCRELQMMDDGLYTTTYLANRSTQRFLPLLTLFAAALNPEKGDVPEEKMFVGHGKVPVMMIHTDMAHPERDRFVGFKGGQPLLSHSHMDNGSFVFDSHGVRWALDMERPAYVDLERPIKAMGGSLWNMGQSSLRWQAPEYNNFNHNTLTVNGKLHNAKGRADFTSQFNSPGRMGGTLDLSPSFAGEASSVFRTVSLVDGEVLEIRDSVTALTDRDAQVRWTMATDASASEAPDGFILSKAGRRLRLSTGGSPRFWRQPLTAADTLFTALKPRHEGISLIGFEATVPAGQTLVFTTRLSDL